MMWMVSNFLSPGRHESSEGRVKCKARKAVEQVA